MSWRVQTCWCCSDRWRSESSRPSSPFQREYKSSGMRSRLTLEEVRIGPDPKRRVFRNSLETTPNTRCRREQPPCRLEPTITRMPHNPRCRTSESSQSTVSLLCLLFMILFQKDNDHRSHRRFSHPLHLLRRVWRLPRWREDSFPPSCFSLAKAAFWLQREKKARFKQKGVPFVSVSILIIDR